ncbi:MarR family winged helix-turn-helix transcriptional regulator [Enterococcus termitis]|jgi:DNA-binding MarR family transcriptional regulator|uniref:HTH marR-type domain-containing protein n=1 Tax=Enterococcus termitis TaxID=332950 RepID=A0A1E5GHT0_9ENTE|nr:winged helix DNA-binding protein [Enterococcus termitis]OEG12262.1 hypothetical protein BCR25_06880 [Enterococcus termitis]OJG98925.1 hypothetical protein RV18_GL002787 [Enterococcus termitis]
MSFAEEAEQELIRLMVENRNSAFSRFEKSNQGESMVIKFLYKYGEPTSPKHLADSLNLSSARIAVVLGSLEKKGLIERNMDENDRRRINVTLTESGKKAAKHEKKQMRDKIVQIFKMMGEDDTVLFIELVAKFVDCAQKISLKEEGDQ